MKAKQMTSANIKSENNNFHNKAIDLISEGDCMIFHKSRKDAWCKPYPVKVYSTSKHCSKANPDVNILLDNGHRSRERMINKTQTKAVNQSKDSRGHQLNERKSSEIPISTEAIAQMLHLSITEKSKVILNNLCSQMKSLDEKTRNSVLNKLNLNERLTIVKAIYSRNSAKGKPISARKSELHSPQPNLAKTRLSSSLSRINENANFNGKPFRKSFSFLQRNSPSSERLKTVESKRDVSNNENQKSSQLLIRQIDELQKLNCELSKTVRSLILKNFKLEQKLESKNLNESKITDLKAQIVDLTQRHDDIIDNVYSAYCQLTKNLKKLKFKPVRSHSSSNLFNQNLSTESCNKLLRSHSLDRFQKQQKYPTTNNESNLSTNQSRSTNFDVSFNEYLANRKVALRKELRIADENLKTIDKIIQNDPNNSAIQKKHLLEKKFLQQHQSTLNAMLQSLE